MNSLIPVLGAFACMFLGYRFYSKFIAEKIYKLDDSATTPAVTMEDGRDYVPTHKAIVFNHHFASIAGLSPIMGPALAVIWGWVPAVIWLVVGAVLMGAVHDFSSLIISVRNKGRSIGDVTRNLVGPRARFLFLFIIFFAIALAMGVFTKVIALLLQTQTENLGFQTYPEAAFPAVMLMVIAIICGILMRQKRIGLLSVSVFGTLLTFFFIWMGSYLPLNMGFNGWVYALLIYAFAASVLPVWLLLQPRDFINAYTLFAGMILMYLGVFFFQPTIVAPALNSNPELPSMVPLLFVVIACGAISGFHSVVASGTTAKQLAKESDARAVGYGGMIAECALGIIAVIACTAGVATQEEWLTHYASWSAAGSMGAKLSVFVGGGANFISFLGIPENVAATFIALVIVSFALTTLDSGTRILRYNVEELGEALNIPFLKNRYLSTLVAIAAIGFLALSPYGTALWVLFGTTNQLLAGLALLTATVYLVTIRRPSWITTIPMVIMLLITISSLLIRIVDAVQKQDTTLIIMGCLILLLAVGLIVEVILFFLQRGTKGSGTKPLEAPVPTP